MGAETELLLLRKLDIKRCDGCLSCDIGGTYRKGVCKIKDDMREIYPKLIEADAMVFGTPAYFDLLSGLLKNFMDRPCPVWPKLPGDISRNKDVEQKLKRLARKLVRSLNL